MSDRAKGSRPLVISDPTLMVRRANDRLVMLREGKEVAAVPLADISHVAVHGPVTLTGAALAGVLDAGIDVTLYSSAGFYRGTLCAAQSKNVYLLLAQVDAWQREPRRLAFAHALLAGKIAGQRAILQRHALDRGSAPCREAAARLKTLERSVHEERDVDAARGVEGSAAAQYFGAFGEMLSEGWSWQGRRHRPAPDPVNAALSFGYALATGEMVRLLTWGGFDTRVGMVHGLRYGRESLALDLVEEFRAPMVDRFVLRTLNRRQLSPTDFEDHDGGAVRLSPDARRRFLEAWEEMLSGRAPALRNETVTAEDRAHGRAQRITRPREGDDAGAETEGDDGDDATPNWRRRMERQVNRLRRFLMKGEDYLPLTRTVRRAAPSAVARGRDAADAAEDGDDGEDVPWEP